MLSECVISAELPPSYNRLIGDSVATTPGERSVTKSSAGGWRAYLVWGWMLATFANFRVRPLTDLTSGDTFDPQVMFQVASWLCFGLIAVWALLRGRANLSLARRGPLAWYLAFIAIALLSATYSPLPTLSAFTALQHAIALVLVMSLGERLDNITPFIVIYVVANWLLVALGAFHVTFGLSWITPPDASQIWSDEERWRFGSAFGHPSQIAIITATAVFMRPTRARTSLGRALLFVLNVLTLLLTSSRTAIMGFASGVIFVVAMRRRLVLALCLSGSLLTLAILIEPSRDFMWSYISRSQSSADIESLTGRIPVYQDALSRAREHWVFGEGFLATRVLLLNDQGNGNGTVHPHNMFLAAILGMGVAGVVFAFGSVASLFATTLQLLRGTRDYQPLHSEAISCAAVLLPIAAFCILDAGFVAKMNPFVLLYLTACARARCMLISPELSKTAAMYGSKKETAYTWR